MNQKHNSVINGKVVRQMFDYGRLDGGYYTRSLPYFPSQYHADSLVYEYHQFLKEVKLWEGILTLPIMEVGDSIYIKEIDTHVTITKRIRTTENLFIYSTSHIAELVKDAETTISEINAKEGLKKYQEIVKRRKAEELEKSKSWFSRLFG